LKTTISHIKNKIIFSVLLLIIFSSLFSGVIFFHQVSAQDVDQVRVYGTVWDDGLNIPADNYTVKIYGDFFLGDSTLTNSTGEYEMYVPSGDMILEISKNGKKYKTHEFTLVRDETEQFDFRINTSVKKEEPFKWVTVDELISDIEDHWPFLILLIVVIIIVPILLIIVDKIFDNLQTKRFKFFDEKSIEFLEKIIKYNILIAFILIVIWILALIFPGFDESVWRNVAPHILAIYTIVILIILMKLFLMILNRGMDYLHGNLATKPKWKVPPRYLAILGIILKYMIILIFSLNIIIIALAIFGMGDVITESIANFFNKNTSVLIFIIIVIVIMYLTSRFLRTFIGDMKSKETARVSPQIADMAGKVGKILIYMLGAMIIIFALLQMAGLGDLGQTLILMISIIIGFVVAMAATGSIGNVLSGFMLNAFRPYQMGDRVMFGEIIGDVVNTNLAFVQLRTLNNELVNIPNNTVIGDKIVNFSRSGAFALTVETSIGYEIPASLVKKLLLEATRETKDIVDNPRPYVLMTKMGDYAINYKLRAYTTNAKAMMQIKSRLQESIQEEFYSHGIEILSPWYLIRRDEKRPTVKNVTDCWETSIKDEDKVYEKETSEKIGGGFDLMEKAIVEPDTGKPSTQPQPTIAQPTSTVHSRGTALPSASSQSTKPAQPAKPVLPSSDTKAPDNA
jgi:small-conductance mechanosensitive channel